MFRYRSVLFVLFGLGFTLLGCSFGRALGFSCIDTLVLLGRVSVELYLR